MDTEFRDRFVGLWAKHFAGADLPICIFYSDDEAHAHFLRPRRERGCVMGQIAATRRGQSLALSQDTVSCPGGMRYLGFAGEFRPGIEHFLSCGIPGEMEGERYKKSPELVKAMLGTVAHVAAPAKYAVFKRWDKLEEADPPQIVVFFAPPDVLSGLFTLANFDWADPFAVIAPFGAGCGTIVQYPLLEMANHKQRAVLGMFDVSARPFVPAGVLTFAVPIARFATMVGNMEESFLITDSWAKVQRRTAGAK